MLTKKFVLVAVMFSFLVAPMLMLHAQDAGALLDLLVRKKLINDQEAEEVRAELTKEAATTSGGNGNYPARSLSLSSTATCVSATNIGAVELSIIPWRLKTI